MSTHEGRLAGRVAIVTGAGSGLGRSHALELAGHGAAVVVNDVAADRAATVVEEITMAHGRAVPSGHDISDWTAAAELIEFAVDSLGGLDVLVNNAGILRDRSLVKMSEAEWDAVVRVDLKGHAAPIRHALAHWRHASKTGEEVHASIVNTTSLTALMGNFGQANYAAAKLGVVALSRAADIEGAAYGVRSNVIAPSARTPAAMNVRAEDAAALAPPTDPTAFDRFDPANVSPIVAWLAEATCPARSQIFYVSGDRVVVVAPGARAYEHTTARTWTVEELRERLTPELVAHATAGEFLQGVGDMLDLAPRSPASAIG